MNLDAIRTYYDEFSLAYERHRRPNAPKGYHALIDDLEVDLVARYGTHKSVLECGCGTGLLLERIATFASSAKGVDLSEGMLRLARERALDVVAGSVTELPFPDESFDVTCAFKVLAHVPEVGKALSEMARVTKKGGVVLAEFYNPLSLRGAAKIVGPARHISSTTRESAVYTRFDPPWTLPRILPPGLDWEASYGIRIVTPFAGSMNVPILRDLLVHVERSLAPTKLAYLGGFFVAILRRLSTS